MIVLASERLLFRAHRPEDLEPFCALESDPEFRRYVGGRPRPRAEAEARFEKQLLAARSNRLGFLAAVYQPDARYIGYCGLLPRLTPDGPVPKEAALAFYFSPAYSGRGLATEAGRALVAHGFGTLGLRRIGASVDARNLASIRVLEKLGFSRAGTGGPPGRPIHEYTLDRPA